MNLQLKTNHIEIIKNHAQKTYPDECCGLILGYIDSEYNYRKRLEYRKG
jgi:proteasome lid subunit RPN8/RPN11